MAKMATRVHVLADETLGGIKREYVEVEREAKVGEKVRVFGHHSEANGIFTVSSIEENDIYGEVIVYEMYATPYYSGNAYVTLEPTDIVHIDGERFRLVDRKAEVGERAIYFYKGESDGIVFDVLGSGESSVDVNYYDKDGGLIYGVDHGAYRVLEPAESESSPKSTDDIIANLVKRIAELERRDEAQRRLNGVHSQRLAELSQRINDTHRDIETWAQEVEELKFKVRIIDDLQDVEVDKLNDTIDKVEHVSHAVTQIDDELDDIASTVERIAESKEPQTITLDIETLTKLIGGVRG